MNSLFSLEGHHAILAASMVFIALALLLLAMGLLVRGAQHSRNRSVVDRALAAREGRRALEASQIPDAAGRMERLRLRAEAMGDKLEQSRFGDSLLADEDRKLIDLCGYRDVPRARAMFVLLRTALALLLPVVALVMLDDVTLLSSPLLSKMMAVFFGFGVGWMLPKWILGRRAGRRRVQAMYELPLMVDLMRLLNGVGLSMDQSLHVIVNEFREVLPVLSFELGLANELYARGRPREQALSRLMNAFESDDLNAICRLIVQVDKHGGAMQEPLNRFGERLRERRKLELKEKVARTTVKMTGVMVVTLLPALLIVTGGAGLLAVLRGLARVTGAG
jgi:tight adherence protein C